MVLRFASFTKHLEVSAEAQALYSFKILVLVNFITQTTHSTAFQFCTVHQRHRDE